MSMQYEDRQITPFEGGLGASTVQEFPHRRVAVATHHDEACPAFAGNSRQSVGCGQTAQR